MGAKEGGGHGLGGTKTDPGAQSTYPEEPQKAGHQLQSRHSKNG